MNVQEAVALLRRHNEWRRGAGGEMIEPRWLGLAIDLLCDHFSHAAEMVCLPPEIDPTSRVLDGIKYAPNFVSGWNRCRVAMLAATPAPVAQKGPEGAYTFPDDMLDTIERLLMFCDENDEVCNGAVTRRQIQKM